ncbi:MAG: PTS sugar transporter subunit IIA [Planctomycetes bacterium]|nr:PTS sugar transporter subunit IIA [Planctomycetota bacterium]MBI3835221.1 PTS sugar transporter subunit IIA [Planctomycetota bacterium]
MKLSELIHLPSIVPELQSVERKGVIRELIQSLADNGAISAKDADAIAKAAIAREMQGSTGFGKGVAVPHVKHDAITKIVATIGRSGAGVDFAALDRAPVYTVFLLLSPSNAPEEHLAAMERIFRYLQRENFRKFLRLADSKQAIIELIKEADETPSE